MEEDKEILEKLVDTEEYNPYNDGRPDEELTADELAQRQNRKLYAPDGRLAAMPHNRVKSVKSVKSVKIKSKEEK